MSKIYLCMECDYDFYDGEYFNSDADGNPICPRCNCGDIYIEEEGE